MDLPPSPPPPPFRRQHHHHPRYENVLRLPDFVYPPYYHHLPPPPPLQPRQSYVLLPPQFPPRNIAPPPMSQRLNFPSIGYHTYEIDLPPKPYLHRNFRPPPPPPQNRESVHLRITHDYSDRNPLSENKVIREGRSDGYIREFAESRDPGFHWGGKEIQSRISDIGDHVRHSDNLTRSHELYNNRHNVEIRHQNGINGCGRHLHDERDCGEKRSDSVMNKWGSEFHKKMDYDGTRNDSINGWIRGLYKDRDHDARTSGTGSGVSDRGLKSYCEGNDDDRRLNHGKCSSRLRSGVSEREFVRSTKRMRLQKDVATCRIQSSKDCTRYNEGHKCPNLTEESSGGSSRGKEKEVFEGLLTRTDGKREGEESMELAIPCKSTALMADDILAPHCPAAETNITSAIVINGIPSSIPGLPTAKSSKNMVKTDLLACELDPQPDSLGTSKELLDNDAVSESGCVDMVKTHLLACGLDPQPDSLGTSKELLDNDAVSESGCVEDDANDLGEDAVKHQPQEDIKLQDLTIFDFGRRCRNRLKRKRKAKKKLLHGTSMEMKAYGGKVTIANDCIIPSASPQHCSAPIDLSEISVKNQSQEDLQLQAPTVVESRSTRRKRLIRRNSKSKKKILHENGMDLRKDSGEITDVNDCIIPSAFPQPCSTAIDLGDISVKNQSRADIKLKAFTVDGVCSTRQKKLRRKWKAKKFLHETCMKMRKVSNEIATANDCIIPSSTPQSHSVDIDLAVKNQSQEDMKLHIITAFGTDIARGKKRKSRKKFDNSCSSQEARCSPEIHASNASSEFHSALPLKPQTVIISDVDSTVSNSKEVFLNDLNIPQVVVDSDDLAPPMEMDFLCEKGSSKEVFNLSRGLSRVEDPSLNLNFDANGLSPSICKKRKVASPRLNLSNFLEDGMVADGLNVVCPNEGHTRLPERETEKREDSCFSSNTEASACQSENEMICGGEHLSNRKPVSPGRSLLPFELSLQKRASENSQINVKLSHSLPEVKNEAVKKLNLVHGKQTMSKNQLISASPKVFPGHNPIHSNSSRKLQSTHVGKSRTWHRNGNSSVAVAEKNIHPSPLPQSFGTKTAQTTQSSYVRKGNSLVRNSSPSAVTNGFQNLSCSVYRLSHSTDNLKNDQTSVSKTGGAEASSLLRTKLEKNSEKPCKIKEDSVEHIKSTGVSECRADPVNNSNTQNLLGEGTLEKKIMYVKRRSNQLVAASNSSDMSILGVVKSQASSSAGYFKSNNNQLVRGSSENHVTRDANRNSRRLVPRTILPRTCTKQMSGGFAKSYRDSKFPLVWKLHDMQSSEKDKTSVVPRKVLPHLSPWKRTTYWRSFMNALSLKPNKKSFSIASQALPLSRKRGVIYTRSTHGYSLRMSKVLSVGDSSLKWSKSIERDSKKVNEEAAQAVAAAEKRKKEGNVGVHIASKSRTNISRERIFRIGLERYKMDQSRRTLHRITADPEPPPSVLQSVKNIKRSYVPRRLIIGNEEYVQIGNGNQLVRDPKKRTRVLASEKVRWSLRTARLKLARKKKYCQFFTRFGKCNKGDGKCPYIHDPSKVAVCTKFLNDLCTSVDCKLTHKVIPERMEDCSYFLKGSCSNENCPYRHANVNSKSAICKNFLRGHCPDGNECQKKHTYICPVFEATGSCPKESTCKLHHPKKKIEKRQPTSEQKAVQGRYFNGGLIGDADVSIVSTEKVPVKGKDDIVGFQEGQFPDYISLDLSDTEVDQEDDFDVLV